MSDTAPSSRPVSLVTTLFIFALLGLFLYFVQRFYHPAVVAPQNETAENLPKELEWKATPASRKEALAKLRDKQTAQAASYAWVDQKAGIVQQPIERAMQLTAEKYGPRK
jgi:hypothetical protein